MSFSEQLPAPLRAPTSPALELYRTALADSSALAPRTNAARLARLARQLTTSAVDLLYPPHCMACGEGLRGTEVLCKACAVKVHWIGHDCCRRCGAGVGAHRGVVDSCSECASHPPVYIESVCAVAKYGHPLRAVILGLKFGGGLQAVPLLTRLLETRIRATGLLAADGQDGRAPSGPRASDTNWILVPVPLARPDFLHRGFNQAAEVAAGLSRAFGIQLEAKLLTKARPTKPQATLDHMARAENLHGVFCCNAKCASRTSGKGVLLIDDVMTTGATLSECARTLHAAGIRRIRGAVIARG